MRVTTVVAVLRSLIIVIAFEHQEFVFITFVSFTVNDFFIPDVGYCGAVLIGRITRLARLSRTGF